MGISFFISVSLVDVIIFSLSGLAFYEMGTAGSYAIPLFISGLILAIVGVWVLWALVRIIKNRIIEVGPSNVSLERREKG